jgi:TonB family protein
MKRFLLIAACSVCALSGGPFAAAQNIVAQAAASDATPQAVLTKLAPPVYPSLARQARITGDVKVQVLIRKDGSVESAEVINGHPILKQAALENAQRSQFECRGCSDQGISYALTHTFGLREHDRCGDIIETQPVRSLKCLYLWKCGVPRFHVWHTPEEPPVEVTQSPGHVTIIVSPACLQTQTAR